MRSVQFYTNLKAKTEKFPLLVANDFNHICSQIELILLGRFSSVFRLKNIMDVKKMIVMKMIMQQTKMVGQVKINYWFPLV